MPLNKETKPNLFNLITNRYRLISNRIIRLPLQNVFTNLYHKGSLLILVSIFDAANADYETALKSCGLYTKQNYTWNKKLWNIKVTIIPIVIGAFGTLTKVLLKGLEDLEVGGRVETIQTVALLKTVRILRRVLETWGDFNLQWKAIS